MFRSFLWSSWFPHGHVEQLLYAAVSKLQMSQTRIFYPESTRFLILSARCGHCQTYHGAKRDGSGGMVVDRDEVYEEGGPAHHCWDHKGPDEHLLDPSSACVVQRAECENFTAAFGDRVQRTVRAVRGEDSLF